MTGYNALFLKKSLTPILYHFFPSVFFCISTAPFNKNWVMIFFLPSFKAQKHEILYFEKLGNYRGLDIYIILSCLKHRLVQFIVVWVTPTLSSAKKSHKKWLYSYSTIKLTLVHHFVNNIVYVLSRSKKVGLYSLQNERLKRRQSSP